MYNIYTHTPAYASHTLYVCVCIYIYVHMYVYTHQARSPHSSYQVCSYRLGLCVFQFSFLAEGIEAHTQRNACLLLSITLSVYLSTNLSTYLSIYLSIPGYLSISHYLPIELFASICISFTCTCTYIR